MTWSPTWPRKAKNCGIRRSSTSAPGAASRTRCAPVRRAAASAGWSRWSSSRRRSPVLPLPLGVAPWRNCCAVDSSGRGPSATPCSTSSSAGEPGRRASPPILCVVEDGFTAAQLEAITAADGPLGIIAGPGCGKTTVLAGRIAFLIRERGFDPSTILAVSFTTEAARALRAQLGQQVGAAAADVAIHTLHALGRRVIDTWAGRLGFDERPSVLHRDEGRALLSATAADLGWDTATFSVAELGAAVDRCRLLADDKARRDHPVWPLARAYEERLLRHGAIHFVAMLTLP